MSSKIEELAERAKKAAAESGGEIKDKLSALAEGEDWEELKKLAGTMGEDAAAFVRKYPLQSVLGAAALGFLLGTTFGKKR